MRTTSPGHGPPTPIDKRHISGPILPPEPPRIMLEYDWAGRLVDGIDKTFPTDYLTPERRMSLFETLQASRAFRSEQCVPTITPQMRARLDSIVHFAPRSSPLRPPLVRAGSAPLAPVHEHPPAPIPQPLGRSDEHAGIVFNDPFAPVHQIPGGKQRVHIQVEAPDGGILQVAVPLRRAQHIRKPSGRYGLTRRDPFPPTP